MELLQMLKREGGGMERRAATRGRERGMGEREGERKGEKMRTNRKQASQLLEVDLKP